MKINPISISPFNSFRAKLTRNTEYAKNSKGETYNISKTKKDLIASYNNQIRAIRAQRDAAIEFDTFMRSEKMKHCLDKLPKGDEIEMVSKFTSLTVDEDGKTQFDPMFLMYKFEDPESRKMIEQAEFLGSNKEDELSICYVQNKDGSIDTQKILEYIINIGQFLGVAQR